ncbi:hypothetical protein BDB01DRAFT_604760 [Pilobolus umbonatus]|nr:hypothetical protein BDB01DRAFT_604760 [Pilobolus umbonatus]
MPLSVVYNNNKQVCKVCLEPDDSSMLISPCHCKGSIKYVHPMCLAGWRKSLLDNGRERDIYHCQLCKYPLCVKQRRSWAVLLHYRIIRVFLTCIILTLILIPAGCIMKACIHFSYIMTNNQDDIIQAWTSHSLLCLLSSSIKSSIVASLPAFQNTDKLSPPSNMTQLQESISNVLYSPFPICFRPTQSNHSLFSSPLMYYIVFPFSDDRLWQFMLCRLEHFHLGFFLLGSINNIYFTCKILNDMFDIVLLGHEQQDRLQEEEEEEEEEGDEERNVDMPMQGVTKRVTRLLKGFLLTYCSLLVILFWVHFNLFAFHMDDRHEFRLKQFLVELPLWILRWVTLGVAVTDFATRGVYRWLCRISSCVEEEDVLSIPDPSSIR